MEEAVSIGTTYLRASTLPETYREHSQRLLREYADARLDLGNLGLDRTGFDETMTRSKRIQEELWRDAAAVSQIDRSAVTAAYLDSLNETIDLHEKRMAALENRVPPPVWLLIISALVIAVFTPGPDAQLSLLGDTRAHPLHRCDCRCPHRRSDTPGSGLIRIDQRTMERLKADLSFDPPH